MIPKVVLQILTHEQRVETLDAIKDYLELDLPILLDCTGYSVRNSTLIDFMRDVVEELGAYPKWRIMPTYKLGYFMLTKKYNTLTTHFDLCTAFA